LAGYEERREAFSAQGVSLIAGTVDSLEDTQTVAKPLNFPVAYGITRDIGDALGSWWDERRNFIQPSEFVVNPNGKVMFSTYSNSPVGRMDPAETLTLITYLNSLKR
jgi:alkyl hydroperoxide reductase subunit AhpC